MAELHPGVGQAEREARPGTEAEMWRRSQPFLQLGRSEMAFSSLTAWTTTALQISEVYFLWLVGWSALWQPLPKSFLQNFTLKRMSVGKR